MFKRSTRIRLYVPLLAGTFMFLISNRTFAESYSFNKDWLFSRGIHSGANYQDYDDASWNKITVPHTARIESLVTGASGDASKQWQGICWYRKSFQSPVRKNGEIVLLKFHGAMGIADVWLNGTLVAHAEGGYLPITIDITPYLKEENKLSVRLSNFDNTITGPKPLSHLDYNFYSGIYRDVELIVKDQIRITDPNLEDLPASGGVFFQTTSVSDESATLKINTHIRNDYSQPKEIEVHNQLIDSVGEIVAQTIQPLSIAPKSASDIQTQIDLKDPKLWSPDDPHLYQLVTKVVRGTEVLDTNLTKVGIRWFEFDGQELLINGVKTFLRGTNRHQEHPYIGYALSNNAQYRDAYRIKNAGFDYVRLSHYPHSPAFMDACDELGLIVMNCISGWQYYSDNERFKNYQYDQAKGLLRRDRNHPCVLLWEVSLNESPMTKKFAMEMHRIAHEELPGYQCFTCGWMDGYDVLIEARQHGGCHKIKDRPCVVSEYGDWEYYAQNAGLNQHDWSDLSSEERNSRQDLVDGETRLLQQVMNFQEAHNENLSTTAFADGLWVMFDYNRGYSNDLETSGCMNIFRLPKPSYYFFKSQRTPRIKGANQFSVPMTYIANRWEPTSPLNIKVFSNCEEVELTLNGLSLGKSKPNRDKYSEHLNHPPFIFEAPKFETGVLDAIGYISGKVVARHRVYSPEKSSQLDLSIDNANKRLAAGMKDAVFVHANLTDSNGTLIDNSNEEVHFSLSGPGQLIGDNPCKLRAGTASILLMAGETPGEITVTARSRNMLEATTVITTSIDNNTYVTDKNVGVILNK